MIVVVFSLTVMLAAVTVGAGALAWALAAGER